ncbi:MAG: DMT family transporter [Tannerellaceae bacterium]|jgi:drug/metabolite transporter (DMT)-like permease|nr:DMT family transporter [Tannerellaceae bacterium]
MKQAFVKLHLSILLAGFTGILGKVITLNEGLLVWYRMLLASLAAALLVFILHRRRRGGPNALAYPSLQTPRGWRLAGAGSLLALHWVFFFGSIKASNVSVGVICFSLTGFFTALVEPLSCRRPLSVKPVAISLLALAGVMLVFHFDAPYRTGVLYGILSSLLAALFTIANKQAASHYPSPVVLLYEMLAGFLLLTALLPLYLHFFPAETLLPGMRNLPALLLFAILCTVCLYLLQIDVLKQISAFTVNLSYNLEPLYSILLAMLFLGEAKELSPAFYAGLALILLSVYLQTRHAWKHNQ